MLRQILEAIDQFAPDAVVFGLDDRSASVRTEAYPAYKAGRAEKDAALVDQLERASALLDALGLRTVTPPGLEADDVSASGAAWAERAGWNCVIITSDRDSFAHISHQTRVLRLINGGIAGSPLLNPARLHALYGIAAEHYLEYAALRGDTSDNLPGVPGIGEKTAPVLLSQMGSMQAVWADIDHCDGANLVAALDSYCEEGRAARSAPASLKRLARPGGPGALRVQHVDHVRAHRPRPRPDARRPRHPRAAPARPDRVARVVGYLGTLRPRSWRCGCSPAARRRADKRPCRCARSRATSSSRARTRAMPARLRPSASRSRMRRSRRRRPRCRGASRRRCGRARSGRGARRRAGSGSPSTPSRPPPRSRRRRRRCCHRHIRLRNSRRKACPCLISWL